MPCMKKVCQTKERSGPLVSSQERRAAVVPLINRSSTGRQTDVVFIPRFPDMACMRKVVTRTKKRRSTREQPGTKSGRRPAHKPGVKCSLCSSIGLQKISFVRASDETFRTVVYDALGGKREGYFLGGPTRRRPVLPRPASPRPAVPPCAAPPRHARGMSRFWNRQV